MVAKPGECLACDLSEGRLPLPGGLIHQTEHWRVEHCTGPLGVGTLIVKPKRHVLHVGELEHGESLEMGPLLQRAARAVRALSEAPQVYVCLWSHGPVHIHFVIQPVHPATIDEMGAHGPQMQAALFARGQALDFDEATRFAGLAAEWFSAPIAGMPAPQPPT